MSTYLNKRLADLRGPVLRLDTTPQQLPAGNLMADALRLGNLRREDRRRDDARSYSSDDEESAAFDKIVAMEDVLLAAKAKTLADAAIQLLLLYSRTDVIDLCLHDEADLNAFAAQVRELLRGIIPLLTTASGIDLQIMCADSYAVAGDPWGQRKGATP